MPNSLPPTPPRSPSPRRPLDTDSVFGSDAGGDEFVDGHREEQGQQQQEPQSNLPAVRRQFLAAGYREGLDAGRNEPGQAQRGFDEGYRVGAALGMRAGLLRGIAAAASAQEKDSQLSQITASLTLEALVENLQTRGLLDRELRGEQLVDEADEDDSNAKLIEAQPEWTLPAGFVDDIATVRQATGLAEAWYQGRYGAADTQPLVQKSEKAAEKND